MDIFRHYDPLPEWTLFWSLFAKEAQEHKSLQLALGYEFKRLQWLYEALTHRSALADYKIFKKRSVTQLPWNERLEFLGDSVLGFCISQMLWQKDGIRASEGQMSRHRAFLIKEQTLADLARGVNLGHAVALGRGESKSGGRQRDALLADALEALIGAIFLDGGLDAARTVVHQLYDKEEFWTHESSEVDYKSRLQELFQQQQQKAPVYKTLQTTGPAHHPSFQVAAMMDHKILGTAWGDNKKKASQLAAQAALRGLGVPLSSSENAIAIPQDILQQEHTL